MQYHLINQEMRFSVSKLLIEFGETKPQKWNEVDNGLKKCDIVGIETRTNQIFMPKCEIYQDIKGEWRWRRTDKKGEILEFSTQGFEKREDCEKNGKEEGTCTSYKLVV